MYLKPLADFAILSQGMTIKDRIKLLLFAMGLKPAASVYLHITPLSLDESYTFEHALRLSKIIYLRSREKSMEEVDYIRRNKIVWKLSGLWIAYDLFHTLQQKEQFLRYRMLWQQDNQRNRRNIIAGKLYGYPACCIASYNKETSQYIGKKYSPYAYYKKLHLLEKKFPLLAFTPCSLACKKSREQQTVFARAMRKAADSLLHHLQEVQVYESEIIIDGENDVLFNGKSVWKTKNGHDYIVLATTPFHGKYWFYNVLSKKTYPRGAVLHATIKHYATHGEVLIGKETGFLESLYHERHLPLLEREY